MEVELDFSKIAKVISGGGAGGGVSMLLEFMSSKGLSPAVSMGENSVSLNSIIIIGVVGLAVYWTKNNSKTED